MQFSELSKKYGDVFQLRMGGVKMVVVNGQRAIRQFYAKPGETLSTPDWFTSRMKAETMDCFIFAPFSTRYWIHKKLLFGAVHRYTTERAQDLETAIHNIVSMFVNEANRKSSRPFDPISHCERSAIVLAFYHSYGRLLDSLTHREVEEALKVRKAAQVAEKKISKCDLLPWMKWLPTMWRPIAKYKTALELYRDWHYREASVLVDAYANKKSHNNCLVDYLCCEASRLDEDDKAILKADKNLLIKTSCNISLFGTLVSLTIPMTWMVLLMALHPKVQQKVREEIHKKVGKARQASAQDEGLLPYTTATLREMFRYVSMAPLGVLKCFTVDTELDGYTIPKNTVVTANLYSANRDNTVFSDADTFDPERFLTPSGTLDEEAVRQVIEAGLGPRRCGGIELMWFELYTFFVSLISSCHIEQAPDFPIDPTRYYLEVGAVLKPFKVIMYEV